MLTSVIENVVYMYFLKKLFNRHFENSYKVTPENNTEQKNKKETEVEPSKYPGKDCTEDPKQK